MTYSRYFSTKHTPQNQPIPGSTQVPNHAGGYAWEVDKWGRLDRFLLMGSEAGTYYVGAQELSVENAKNVLACIEEDPRKTVDHIVSISTARRAPKNEPALFALAMVAKFSTTQRDKAYAYRAWGGVARTGTDLFHINEYAHKTFGLCGKGYRRANQRWYEIKTPTALQYQVLKYRQRDGWTHADVLRLARPYTRDPVHNAIYKYVVDGEITRPDLSLIAAFEKAKTATETELCILIEDFGLTREMIPTEMLNSAAVWESLLRSMPPWALLRNLGKMGSVGLLKPMSQASLNVRNKLGKITGVHPWNVYNALATYGNGRGSLGDLTWTPVPQIVDALSALFYASFGEIRPTGQRFLLGLDVSGSMHGTHVTSGFTKSGRRIEGVAAHIAAAVMSMAVARAEPNYAVVAFDRTSYPLTISPRQRIDDVVRTITRVGGGGTDCALPILWAAENNIPVDIFAVFTDNETWAGQVHPSQALQEYRRVMGIQAKLAVVAMAANSCTIADPTDAGHINLVGMDSNCPLIISNFAGGNSALNTEESE